MRARTPFSDSHQLPRIAWVRLRSRQVGYWLAAYMSRCPSQKKRPIATTVTAGSRRGDLSERAVPMKLPRHLAGSVARVIFDVVTLLTPASPVGPRLIVMLDSHADASLALGRLGERPSRQP